MIIATFVVIFNIFLLIFPQTVLHAAREGLLLWFNNVLPSLLPFMIASNMLVLLGFADVVGRFLSGVMGRVFGLPRAAGLAVVMGFTGGYPVGAKTVADLRAAGKITAGDAEHLLAFCVNAAPLFVLGTVGAGMFDDVRVGYVLLAGHLLAALVVGVLFRGTGGGGECLKNYKDGGGANIRSVQFGKILNVSVKGSMESMAVIGGLIIFFNVVIAVLEVVFYGSGVIGGLLEVTAGVRRVSGYGVSLASLGAAGFFIGFGGFCVHAQTVYFMEGSGVRAWKYVAAKALHGVLAAGFTVIIWWVFG